MYLSTYVKTSYRHFISSAEEKSTKFFIIWAEYLNNELFSDDIDIKNS